MTKNNPIDLLLGSGPGPTACRVFTDDIAVHWFPLPAQAGDPCFCGARRYTPDPEIDDDEEESMDDDEMRHYSRALDEIYRLRTALAYEASVLDAHLDFKTFPKSRRQIAEQQIGRMRSAACGKAKDAYAGVNSRSLRQTRDDAGMDQCFTRSDWEEEV